MYIYTYTYIHIYASGELDKLGKSWMSELLACLETLPICVSLATASPAIIGFPLIYVNEYFEKTTGYTKSEVIGQNCKFLQIGLEDGHDAEEESISKLSCALREAKPVRVAITNFRKNGTPFRNLLAMKPIFDQNGTYCFVLGIQFDITDKKEANAIKMSMIDDFFKALPNTFYNQNEDNTFKDEFEDF
jgi:PAS domain S-box-containing protein